MKTRSNRFRQDGNHKDSRLRNFTFLYSNKPVTTKFYFKKHNVIEFYFFKEESNQIKKLLYSPNR
ncbi:hypothetical protein B2G50_10285 [Leptospira interrogans serovar Canicola]|nr:hypothetical protein B2G50_10285 [Leptospira interrogans serovar Canicola]